MSKPQIVKSKVSDLIKADWNYKTDGTEDQINNLMEAIRFANSCGVLMVREIDIDGKIMLEVMDGNHRLEAIKRLGWDMVPIENFGKLDQADAIVLTRQRNEQWFEDDKIKMSSLFNQFVFDKYNDVQLNNILPDDLTQLQVFKDMENVDWQAPEQTRPSGDSEDELKITIKVTPGAKKVWHRWQNNAEGRGAQSDEEILLMAIEGAEMWHAGDDTNDVS